MTDDVVERARSGDEPALRALYETHRGRVFRLAVALLGDRDEAEDVMQDVMVFALTNLDRYDSDRAALSTWLHTITLNRCRDRARRRFLGLRRAADWLRATREPGRDHPDERIDSLDASGRVRAAMMRLTVRQREALVLREVEGLSLAELAEVLGVPLRTAQARVTSAHAAMRRELVVAAPDGGGE